MAIIVINPYQYAAPIGPSADPYSDYVSLLLHGNGTNGSTTFIDSSSHGHTVTANGDAEISTTQSKFGGASMYFDGSGDYLTLTNDASFVFGTGDFTVEMWVYHTSENNLKIYYDGRPASTNGAYVTLYRRSSNELALYVNTADRIVGTTSILQNAWYHIAVCREGSSTKLFLNGIQEGSTFTDTTNYLGGTSRPVIGAEGFNPSSLQMQGYIDDLRITKGVARYTSNFNPPTTELPDPSDPDFDSVSLLLHGDGTNGSTTFIDSSNNSHTVTPSGNAQISTTQSKFGGASMYFDGSGDYLSIPDSDQFEIGSGDFTFEAWIYLTDYSAAFSYQNYVAEIICKDSSQRSFSFQLRGTSTSWTSLEVNLFASNSTYIGTSATTSFGLNTWYHVAAVRNGTSLRLYKNGVDVGGGTNATSVQNTTTAVTVGSQNPYWISLGYGYYFPGYIDDLRVTKGVARYTSNFTPPTAPLPHPVDPDFSSVSLLLHGDDFTDSSSHGHTLSNTNITVDTTTKKYGSGSLKFSTSAYGTFPHDTSFDIGTGDFTIEAWIYPQNSGTRGIAHNHPSFTGGGFTFFVSNNSLLVIQNFTNGSSSRINIVSTTTVPNGTWAHVAYSRSGGTGYLFIDGNLEGTHTDSRDLTNNSAFYIGVAEGSNYRGIGYIDDLRFTVGVGRYTSSFNPPTEPFPND